MSVSPKLRSCPKAEEDGSDVRSSMSGRGLKDDPEVGLVLPIAECAFEWLWCIECAAVLLGAGTIIVN